MAQQNPSRQARPRDPERKRGGITYKCGGDSQLAVTKSTTGTADDQTHIAFALIAWIVDPHKNALGIMQLKVALRLAAGY
jgi:hypothetical protein